jgi:predicted nucleotidyltransferase
MRLRAEIVKLLVKAITPFLSHTSAKLYLFGSRTKDQLKGGDIDLALIVEDEGRLDQLKTNKHRLLAAIHREIGERKVDLRIGSASSYRSDPFFQSILMDWIELYDWQRNGCGNSNPSS